MVKLLNVYLNTVDQTKQDYHVRVYEERINDVCAVYIDGFSNRPLDSDLGAAIEFTIEDVKSWMADFRHSEYWCRPEFGTDFKDIPNETQGLVYEKNDGTYGAVLPVVSEQYKCVLSGCSEGFVQAKLFSWFEKMNTCKGLAFAWAEGANPYELIEKCAEVCLKLLNNGCRLRKERRYPEIFEYLGWCSWDAFEIRVDETGIIEKCREFRKKGIPVKWIILDDMWAEVRDFYNMTYRNRSEMFRLMHSSKLYSFKADPKRFPNGLKACIEKVNEFGINVGMWHPATGYWAGVSPDGEIYRDYKDLLIQTPQGTFIPTYEEGKAYLFYSAFHDYLQSCGAEFVKIDNQSMTRRFYKGLAPVGKAARQYHNAIEASVGRHFDNRMINCMGMASEDMWNRNISPISRCSDDFQPENREWFSKHILQCAYNTLIQGQFYYCDWDMWWTDDSQALKNSVLRAISGGPIYISDALNRSNADILRPLVFEDGRILRCDRLAVPAKDCLTVDPLTSGRIFKLQNMCNNCGIVAAFNLSEENKPVEGSISKTDVEGLEGDEFAVYEHFSKEVRIIKSGESIEVRLADNDDFKLYIIVPLINGSGVIGRIDKFISPKTVKYNRKGEAELIEDGPCAYIKNRKLVIEN